MSKEIYKSNAAADKALKRISVDLVQQLNLSDTTLYLHAMNGLTPLETEKLQNSYVTELERKRYLVTTVIPSKGLYKGMRLLRRALKQSGQGEVFNSLEKAYEAAVDEVIAEKLRLSHTPELKHERGQSHPVQATFSDFDDSITSAMFSDSDLLHRGDGGNRKKNRRLDKPTNPSTSSSSSDDDDDDINSLDTPVQQQQTLIDINVQVPVSPDSNTIAFSVTSPYHQRSNHISHQSNPYTANLKPPEQAVSVAINVVPKNPSNDDSDDHDGFAASTANVSWLQFICAFLFNWLHYSMLVKVYKVLISPR